MDRETRKKLKHLDNFYLVEIIRDGQQFSYDRETAEAAAAVLRDRGISDKEIETIYNEEILPQDRDTAEEVQRHFSYFNRAGRAGGALSLIVLLILIPLIAAYYHPDSPSTGAILLIAAGLLITLLAPLPCIMSARRISKALLLRYDSSPGRELLYDLDENVWKLALWFLLAPGFFSAFLRTKKQLGRILSRTGLLK